MKFNLGDLVFWVEASSNYGKEIPCPMCFGKRFVTIILGNGESELSQCGFCQHGIGAPSGTAKTWEPEAKVMSGAVTGISTRDGIKFEVGYRSFHASELFDNEQGAKVVREEKYKEVKESAEHWFKESFINAKKKQIWSNGYHKDCIKSAERTIEWHQYRLGLIASKKEGASL